MSELLQIPNTDIVLEPGNLVRLHRFEKDTWVVGYGWFSFSGNRAMCGWFLSKDNGLTIKPLLKIDLADIYIVTTTSENVPNNSEDSNGQVD